MSRFLSLADEALLSLETLGSRAAGLIDPSLRIGVTGLSRAGKTVFISALIQNLVNDGHLPLLSVKREGRFVSARIDHQLDQTVPRFQYEDHVATMVDERQWPESTRALSEFRITITFESAGTLSRTFGPGKLSIDIIDYPGEWLLDLPLLAKSYREFSADSIAAARSGARADHSADWLEVIGQTDPNGAYDEPKAENLHQAFAAYLRACKADARALSTLPPGRFLMPGDLAGSPALTFAPLDKLPEGALPKGSIAEAFERRFEAYKAQVVRPFFKDHVARLDRQVVLVDAMQAINAGPESLADLEQALSEILACFRPGQTNFLSRAFLRRLDRILVVATKADHLHHESHDGLRAIVRRLTNHAIQRAQFSGATVEVMALAAVRATREGTVRHNKADLPVVVGTPQAGETIDGETFDGETETAIFPGDLPKNPESLFKPGDSGHEVDAIRFVRFLPPPLERVTNEKGETVLTLPHIRMDKAIEFLIGDHVA